MHNDVFGIIFGHLILICFLYLLTIMLLLPARDFRRKVCTFPVSTLPNFALPWIMLGTIPNNPFGLHPQLTFWICLALIFFAPYHVLPEGFTEVLLAHPFSALLCIISAFSTGKIINTTIILIKYPGLVRN